MNASQRRVFRRALSTATGIIPGLKVCRMTGNGPGATVATVQSIAPTGKREVMVKRRDNRVVSWPLAAVMAVPA